MLCSRKLCFFLFVVFVIFGVSWKYHETVLELRDKARELVKELTPKEPSNNDTVDSDYEEKHDESGPIAITKLGKLRGSWMNTENGLTFAAFQGVPYAKPPVGDLRFKVWQPVI